MASNADVCEAFKNRQTEKSSNMCSDGEHLYSYEAIIAAWLGDQIILNGDSFSTTTSKHQNLSRSYFNNPPTTSFSALEGAGLFKGSGWEAGKFPGFKANVELVVYESDYYRWHDEGSINFEIPVGATVRKVKAHDFETGTVHDKGFSVHRPGAIIFRRNGECFLAAMDEGSYFISKLPYPVHSVNDAFNSLKPPQIRTVELKGLEVLRQGEWFFVPTENPCRTKKSFEEIAKKNMPLPRPSGSNNPHICTRLLEMENRLFATGTVKHRDHKRIKLPGFYEVIRNTSLGDWSAGQRVD